MKNLETAKAFYGGVLEFKPVGPAMGPVQVYLAGRTVIVAHREPVRRDQPKPRPSAGGLARLFDLVMTELKGKGVVFEHYDMPNVIRDGNVHRAGRRPRLVQGS